MTFIATIIGIAIGAPLAVLLYITNPIGLSPCYKANVILSFGINAVRSIPYIILTIALIPFTRFLVGTAGVYAATLPLSICATLLIAKIVDESLQNLPTDLMELGKAIGASNFQIITKIILPEALANIISGITIVVVNLLGFSAMAGAVGVGGLGDLAIRYGYQRYNTDVLLIVIMMLIILVQFIQLIGDKLVLKIRK